MKLELESTAATTLHSPFAAANDLSNSGFDAARINEMLKAGIDAAKQGNRAEARALLLGVTENQADNETAWLWLASISEYPEELLVFLNHVLSINPHNERALEWLKATKSLLAKTFVQRGITASRENRKDFASQCFQQALAHDNENELAWMWLASVADSAEEKTAHLEKVLMLNPENETARASLRAVRHQMSQALLKKANVAAISGEHEAAREMLDELMNLSPEMEEAWILKAYLSEGHEAKTACFEQVLALNPENETAHAGIASLNAIRQRELERQAQRAELERLQAEAQAQQEQQQQEQAQRPVYEEAPELFFDLDAAAQNQSAHEEYPDFTCAEEAAAEEDEAYKTSPGVEENQAESAFLQDAPTQELEEEFVQNPEAQPAFAVESESRSAEENRPAALEFFAAERTEEMHFSEPEFSAVAPSAAETEIEEFAVETAAAEDGGQVEMLLAESRSATDENHDFESKDFEIMTGEEDSYFQETASPFEESSEAKQEEISEPSSSSSPLYSAGELFTPAQEYAVTAEQFSAPHSGDYQAEAASSQETFLPDYDRQVLETEDEVEEICLNDNETLDNYFRLEDESEENHFDAGDRSQPYVEEAEADNPAAANPLSEPVADDDYYTDADADGYADAASFACPFCAFASDEAQSFVCPSCQSVLTLSDLEMLLSNQQADRALLAEAIERMESEMAERDFDVEELTQLGVAHLNAKNLRQGYNYLQQASQMNQNNVVLGGQVNALAIRLDEIEQHESKTQEARSCTILVVDDSPTVRKLISGKLEKSGHTVVLAVDGMDALSKISEVVPDLILLDITMPRMDGYQVCKLIRSNNSTKDVPVVMISGKDGFFDKVRGRMAGSTGYITKPFGPDTLMRTIDAYLN